MFILGIESSCDETSAAVIKDGREILSNCVSSQIEIHRPFGGVVPELASRHHSENISYIVSTALDEAQVAPKDIDLVAVTHGPGLVGSLIVGIMYARGFAEGISRPVVGINHLEGHLFASLMEYPTLDFPFLSLLVSGGHTMLVVVNDINDYEILGSTIDDAAGEAFDKVAKILGLGYPGGPIIDRLARQTDKSERITFPRPLMHVKNYDFSFSGLKTAVLYHTKNSTNNHHKTLHDDEKAIIAASFQDAVVDTLVHKTMRAVKETGMKRLAIGGGVAANGLLRDRLRYESEDQSIQIFLPSRTFCTDNAAMIASCAFFRWQSGLDRSTVFEVDPKLKL